MSKRKKIREDLELLADVKNQYEDAARELAGFSADENYYATGQELASPSEVQIGRGHLTDDDPLGHRSDSRDIDIRR